MVGAGGAVLAVFVANDGIPILTRASRNITSSRSGGPACAAAGGTCSGSGRHISICPCVFFAQSLADITGSTYHRWRTHNNEMPADLGIPI